MHKAGDVPCNPPKSSYLPPDLSPETVLIATNIGGHAAYGNERVSSPNEGGSSFPPRSARSNLKRSATVEYASPCGPASPRCGPALFSKSALPSTLNFFAYPIGKSRPKLSASCFSSSGRSVLTARANSFARVSKGLASGADCACAVETIRVLAMKAVTSGARLHFTITDFLHYDLWRCLHTCLRLNLTDFVPRAPGTLWRRTSDHRIVLLNARFHPAGFTLR